MHLYCCSSRLSDDAAAETCLLISPSLLLVGVDENTDVIRICRLAQLEVPDLGGGAVISERRVKKSQIRMNELRTTVFISVHNT